MKKIVKSLLPVLTLALLCVIWGHSAMDADMSTAESDYILDFLKTIFGDMNGLTDFVVRKAAHFTEFTMLGVLLSADVFVFLRKADYMYIPPFGGLVAACIDETIQLYSAGRSSMLMDVWIDFSGVITGTLLAVVICIIYIKINKKPLH